ncbi:hypothetical protein AKJ09_03943 [Labilithrix luteola]|uniref:Uncharacterized protein n=2 Tax=Labilithrix luteola TaxID=1391654 RepID=A0A0K1PVY2_9BACT|nr:hypothetical protein AKJ09_03943 [Labilithrix luteola]
MLAAPHAIAASELDSADAEAPAADAGSLEREIAAAFDDQTKALAVEDCATACRALSSIQRAANKLCELDPGPRCATARSKVEVATQRVREACPQCAFAALALTPPALAPPERAPTPASVETVHGRGGCGGCAMTSSTATRDGWIAALVVLGGVLVLSRRRRHLP